MSGRPEPGSGRPSTVGGADDPRCESCGTPLDGARVCPVCGEPAGPPERRVVTVLFADLTGYTEMCARLDPEEVHAFVRPAMTALRRVVESYGGTVPQVMGDGFMAVFGVPTGHEDDAERALRAAFALHEHVRRHNEAPGAVRIPSLRVGVNTGEVLVAASREASGFSLTGEVVNLGSRLCSLAEPGHTLVGERTRELGRHAVDFGPRRLRRVRGLADLVPVYEPVGARPAPEQRPAPPFVGRERETAALRAVVDAALASGRATTAVVVGEAGVGKTRIVAEVAAATAGAVVLRGRCTPYGERRPFSALTDAVLAHAGGAEDRPGAPPLAELVERTVDADVAAAVGRSLAQLAGAAVPDPRGEQGDVPRAQEQALRLVVEGLARTAPVVLVLDDLHSADDHLRDLLAGLASRPWRGRIAVLGTARPDTALPAGLPAYPVDALARPDVDALLTALLGGPPEPWLADELWARTGGNPLFVEDCVRLLVESGAVGAGGLVTDVAAVHRVPASMRMLVVARLDALTTDERTLLRQASVTGDRTWDVLLAATSGVADVEGTLAALERRGLLRREPRSRLAGATEWAFRHTLVRDVAYDSFTYRDRSERHRVVAEWLEAYGAPAADLAHHYEQAWLLGRNRVPELGARAAEHLLRWGREVFAYQARAADAVFRRGIAAATEAGDAVPPLLVAQLHAWRATALAELQHTDQGLAEVDRVLAVAPPGPEGARVVATALLARGRMLSYLGRVEEAQPELDRALELFERAGDLSGQARCLRATADLYRYIDMARLADMLRAAYDRYVAAGDRWGRARLAEDLAYFFTLRGGEEYAHWHREATRLAEDAADLRGQAALLRARGFYALYRGERAEAVATLRRAGERAVAAGNRWVEGDALVSEALALAGAGELDRADDLLARAVRLATDTDWPRLRAVVDVVAARVAARRGRVAEAAERLAAARATLTELGATYDLADADGAEAEILLDRGRCDEAAPVARRAWAPWEPLGAELYVLPVRLVPARAALLAGAPDAADRLAALAGRATACGAPRYAELAAAAAEQALLLAGAEAGPAPPGGPAPRPGGSLPEAVATAAENAGLRAWRAGDPEAAAAAFARAAATWSTLGVTVWELRARCWHALAAGTVPDEAVAEGLARLAAPAGSADRWRAQLLG